MKRRATLGVFIMFIVFFSGCSIFQDIASVISDRRKDATMKKAEDDVQSPYARPEVFCNYAHYFRA